MSSGILRPRDCPDVRGRGIMKASKPRPWAQNTEANGMKLCIRQQVFSWKDKFSIFDEQGQTRYTVEGELFSFGKKLHLYDLDGREAAFLQQKVMSFTPRFFVYIDGREVAEIVKKLTFLRPKYEIEGLGWQIEGDFWDHDYRITRSGLTIVTIRKQWLTWGDCYELDVADPRDEITALAVVLAIDAALAASQSSGS